VGEAAAPTPTLHRCFRQSREADVFAGVGRAFLGDYQDRESFAFGVCDRASEWISDEMRESASLFVVFGEDDFGSRVGSSGVLLEQNLSWLYDFEGASLSFGTLMVPSLLQGLDGLRFPRT
jgi:hypothetical protein